MDTTSQNTDSKNIIYGLIDPRDGTLRYIGKSVNGIKRFYAHCTPSALKRNRTRTGCWIKSLINKDFKPEFSILESVEDSKFLPDLERFWIASIRATGAELYNHTDGGEGTIGRTFQLSKESRAKIGQALKGRKQSLELIEKRMSKIRGKKRNPMSEETKDKIRQKHVGKCFMSEKDKKQAGIRFKGNKYRLGKKQSPEGIERIRTSLLGNKWCLGIKHGTEARENMAKSQRVPYEILATGEIVYGLESVAKIFHVNKKSASRWLSRTRKWPNGVVLFKIIGQRGEVIL